MLLPIMAINAPIDTSKINLVQPTAQVQPAKKEPIIIEVKEGDTLTKLASDNKTTVERLFDKNTQLTNPDLLKPGEKLTVPFTDEVLEKRVITPPSTEKTAEPIGSSSSTGLNGYYLGQCTGWVAQHRYVPPGWGDASNWRNAAQSQGWTVSSTPIPGAIGWRSGHVVFVISVSDGTVTISEQNYDWNSGIRTITIPISSYLYLYE